MSTAATLPNQYDVDWKEDVVEVRVLDEMESRSVAISPPFNAFAGRDVSSSKFDVGQIERKQKIEEEVEFAEIEFSRLSEIEGAFSESAVYHHRLSSVARMAGRNEKAISHARRAAEIDSSVFYRLHYASVLLEFGAPNEAVEIFKKLAGEGCIDAKLRLTDLSISSGDIATAARYVLSAIEQDPLDWRANMVAGALSLMQSKYSDAIHHFRIAASERPRSYPLALYVTLAQLWSGNHVAALKASRFAAFLNPFDKRGLYLFSDLAIHNNHKSAKKVSFALIRDYLRVYPDEFAVSRITHLSRELGEQRTALGILNSLPNKGTSIGITNDIGVLLADLGEKNKAYGMFQKSVSLGGQVENLSDTDEDQIFLAAANASNLLLENGEYDATLEFVESLLKGYTIEECVANPNRARLLSSKLRVYYYKERLDLARKLEKEIEQTNIYSPRLLYEQHTARVCYFTLVTGDYKAALQASGVALEASDKLNYNRLASKNVALGNHIYCLLETNDVEDALRYSKDLRLEGQGIDLIRATLGLLQIRLGNLKAGESLYRFSAKSVKSKSLRSAILKKMHYELANALASKDRGEARRHLKSALKQRHAKNIWPTVELDRQIRELSEKII